MGRYEVRGGKLGMVTMKNMEESHDCNGDDY